MTYFPLFLDLSGRACLLVGEGAMALAKARLLLDAGARIDCVTESFGSDFARGLAGPLAEGRIRRVPPAAALKDLGAFVAGYEVVIAASGERELDQRIARAAQAAGRPVNVVDRTDLSTFIMPALVRRGDVLVAISTSGAAPVLARNLRAEIETLLPARLGEVAAFARSFRRAVKATLKWEQRKAFWERFFSGPIARDILAGHVRRAHERMLSEINRAGAAPVHGSVHIVGTGPGNPDLLTLRAVQLMRDADVVLYDNLVGPDIFDYVRRDAERIFVGKSRSNHIRTQTEINDLMVQRARAGQRVVRLKGGDPFIFGRGGEEVDHLRRHGIEVEIVPGITAATGCAAASGIPLTHRDHAQTVTFVTGHGAAGEPDLDWAALARPGHTIVVYMGLTQAPVIADRLIRHGLPETTPVAIIENGTLPQQKILGATLGEMGDLVHSHRFTGPVLVIVGDVVAAGACTRPAVAAESVRRIA